jgi:hypothetical protein
MRAPSSQRLHIIVGPVIEVVVLKVKLAVTEKVLLLDHTIGTCLLVVLTRPGALKELAAGCHH